MEEVKIMWSIPDWVPAAAFAGFWTCVGLGGIWNLLRNN